MSVLALAEARGVPVQEMDGLPFSCVGLVQPVRADGAAPAFHTPATRWRPPRP